MQKVNELIEIRFHGTGGQGAVIGAMILAEAAYSEGKQAQKIPVYGSERRGGAVTVFLRLDDKPVRRICEITDPDVVVVLDAALAQSPIIRNGIKRGGIALLNTKSSPDEVDLGVKLSKVATVDATGIFTELFGSRGGIPITNTIMLGALSKTTSCVKLESLFDPIMKQLRRGIGEQNIEACKRGYEAVLVKEA